MKKRLIRWLAVLCTACICQAATAQRLQKLEFFFDKDPGVGKGAVIALPATTMLDSTVSFDVSALHDGLHFLFIRVQDDSSRWSLPLVSSFVKTTGNNMLAVKKLEYFFDADPGIGKGTPFALNAAATVDSLVSLNVSSLADGLHLLYLRAQDASGQWSTAYTASFVKTTGSDSAVITKVEYFFDKDPGPGKATAIGVPEGNPVADTLALQVPDNGADRRFLGLRAMDKKGQWSLLYADTVNLCNLYKPKADFTWVRFGNQYSFIDSTQNNNSHKLLWRFDNLGVDSVSNPQFEFPIGNHTVSLVAGTGCRQDSISIPLFSGLEKYYPDTALTGGKLVMDFYGGSLDTTVTVTLTGPQTITPFAKTAFGLKELYAVFDLHTVPVGLYDVNLHFPNGYDTTVHQGLRIGSPGNANTYEPDISVDIVGPDVARPNATVDLQVVVTNNGGMLAESIPLWLTIGENGRGDKSAYDLNVRYTPPAGSSFNYVDNVPTYTALDTLFGQPWNGRLHSMIIPYLNAGESYVHKFSITAPANHGDYVDIYSWTGHRMHGSPLRPLWGNCIDAAADLVIGFVPGWSCYNSLYNYAVYDLPGFYHGSTSVGNFGWSTFSALLGCIPGETAVKALASEPHMVDALTSLWKFTNNRNTLLSGLYSMANCNDANDAKNLVDKKTRHRVSVDPNSITGPTGYNTGDYINGRGKAGYQIMFENLPTATANAQRVYIADTLDKTKLDLNTFALTSFSFGDTSVMLPPQRQEFTTTVDLRPKAALLVRVNAKLDTATGILRYAFLSLDPVTRDTLPQADVRGFLPPDVNGKDGLGTVTYIVSPRKALITGDVIANSASITFDNNAAILTNTWLNTIDKDAPQGRVMGGTKLNDTTVRLALSGTDVGAGIHSYKLYAAENSKLYVYIGATNQDTIRFTGSPDSTYRFFAVPMDSVNNTIPKAPAAEYTVTFGRPLPVTLLSFTAQKQQSDVLVGWKVATEEQFSHYEVERSLDGSRFEKIGTVAAQPGTGTKAYSFTDVDALVRYSSQKEMYYRLKMVDVDHTAKYSRVAKISLNKIYTVGLYPNPASSEIFVDGLEHYHTIQIADANGKVVMKKPVIQGMYSINIANLKAGTYIVTLLGNEDTQSLKFVKL